MTFLSSLAKTPTSYNNLAPSKSRSNPTQQDFLRLLTTQLAHQDPLSPQDSQAFVEQLATFSSLEQLGNIKSSLDGLSVAQASVVSATAVQFAGREAMVASDSFKLSSKGEEVKLGALLPTAGKVEVTIRSSGGTVIKKFTTNALKSGVERFTWDGTDLDGNAVNPGDYKLEVKVTDDKDNTTNATALVRGKVESVTFEKGFAELRVLGRLFGLGKVLEIG